MGLFGSSREWGHMTGPQCAYCASGILNEHDIINTPDVREVVGEKGEFKTDVESKDGLSVRSRTCDECGEKSYVAYLSMPVWKRT